MVYGVVPTYLPPTHHVYSYIVSKLPTKLDNMACLATPNHPTVDVFWKNPRAAPMSGRLGMHTPFGHPNAHPQNELSFHSVDFSLDALPRIHYTYRHT